MFDAHYNKNRVCTKCGKRIYNDSKSGFCGQCRDRTGANNPFFGHHHSPEFITRKAALSRIQTKAHWQNPEYREKVCRLKHKPRDEAFKKKQSANMIKLWKNNSDRKKKHSKEMKQTWQDGRMTVSAHGSYNRSRAQQKLFNDIKEICVEAMYDKTIRIGERWYYPDIFLPRENMIIEYYGDYWHANPKTYKANDIVHHNVKAKDIWKKDKDRIKALQSIDYKVYVVWHSDYKTDKEKVLRPIINHIEWESCSF